MSQSALERGPQGALAIGHQVVDGVRRQSVVLIEQRYTMTLAIHDCQAAVRGGPRNRRIGQDKPSIKRMRLQEPVQLICKWHERRSVIKKEAIQSRAYEESPVVVLENRRIDFAP